MKKLAYVVGVSLALVGCGAPADPPVAEPAPAAPSASAPAVMTTSLSIVAPSMAVRGQTAPLTAYAMSSDGNKSDMTAAVTWGSSDLLVAAVVDNKLYTIGAGTATLTASLGNVKSRVDITVVPKEIVALTIEADAESAQMGTTRTWSVLAKYNDDSVVDVTADAAWSSSDSTIAAILASGQIYALNAGMATIIVGYQGHNAAAPFLVMN